MPYKNTAVTVSIVAWDTSNNVGKTGDAANITVRGVGDGTEYTPAAPSITEVDAVNLPGVYKVSIAAGENNYSFVTLGGKSVTSNVSIIPISWANETNSIPQSLGTQAKTDVANAVWNELTISHSVAGSFGSEFTTIYNGTTSWQTSITNSLVAKIGSVNDLGATPTTFKTSLTDVNDFWNDCLLSFTDGALLNQTKPILSYSQTNGTITVSEPFTSSPANNEGFVIIKGHVHPVGQIVSGVWQDTAAGDFNIAGSIGKSLFTSGNAPGAASGLALVGSDMGTITSVTNPVTVGTNNDKTGYSLTQTFPSNFSSMLISVGGAVTVGTNSDKTGYTLSSAGLDAVLIESGIIAGANLTDDAGSQLTAINLRQAMSLCVGGLAGVLTGAATTDVSIKGAGLPTGNTRIDATVDANGNRSALVLKVPT